MSNGSSSLHICLARAPDWHANVFVAVVPVRQPHHKHDDDDSRHDPQQGAEIGISPWNTTGWCGGSGLLPAFGLGRPSWDVRKLRPLTVAAHQVYITAPTATRWVHMCVGAMVPFLCGTHEQKEERLVSQVHTEAMGVEGVAGLDEEAKQLKSSAAV